jgi:hypothetical protein
MGPRAGTIMGEKIKIVKLTTCTLKCPDDPNMFVQFRNVYGSLDGKTLKIHLEDIRIHDRTIFK